MHFYLFFSMTQSHTQLRTPQYSTVEIEIPTGKGGRESRDRQGREKDNTTINSNKVKYILL